jgi:hypothetical protein
MPASAQSLLDPQRIDQRAFVFAGRFHSGWAGESFRFWESPYEDNFVLGAGYQRFFGEWPDTLHWGAEFGIAARLGEVDSLEAWGGVVARYDGWLIADTVRISPAITWGLSAVTDTIGVETERAGWIDSDVPILFYLGPELNISLKDQPVEAFWRIQHRSGAWGTIAHIDGSNANVVGLRWKF